MYCLSVLVCCHHLGAQEVLRVPSKFMGTRVPVMVQVPADYDGSKKYPLVYMLHGYSEGFDQWGKITDLRKLATDHQMIVACPEGFASFYLDSPVDKASQYERFFFGELVPYLHNRYLMDERNIFITGLSMGGYGALSLYIKHSDYFNTAASTSGALEIDYDNYKRASFEFFGNERLTDDLMQILGGPHTGSWPQYSISTLLEGHPTFDGGFFLDCGLEDPLLADTMKIKQLALARNLPIRFALQPGGHDAHYWAKAIDYHFVYFGQHLKADGQ